MQLYAETRQVVVLSVVSFGLLAYATNARTGEWPTQQKMVAWAFLFVGLVLLSDFQQTATIAAALMWLITLTIFLGYGTTFFTKIAGFVEDSVTTPVTRNPRRAGHTGRE